MKTKLLATAIVATGVLGAGVASAMEFDVYGSLRGGLYQADTDGAYEGEGVDEDGTVADITALGKGDKSEGRDALDLGHNGNFYNRIGIRGEEDLGNGMSAGFRIERGVGDTLTRRHENVWLSGGFGKVTLGQTDNAYRNAAIWDQAYFLGGQARSSDGGSRPDGIRYDSNFGGPFSFSLHAIASDAEADEVADADMTMVTGGGNTITVVHPEVKDEDGVDAFAASASFDAGAATVNLGYYTNNQDNQNPGKSYDVLGISAKGAVGGFSWYLAYEQADDNTSLSATETDATCTDPACVDARNYVNEVYTTPQDREVIGVFLGFSPSERQTIYVEYETADVDGADKNLGGLGLDATLLGYSHKLGPNATFITEYVSIDKESDFAADASKFIAGVKVDF